jgi:hypothetical protein
MPFLLQASLIELLKGVPGSTWVSYIDESLPHQENRRPPFTNPQSCDVTQEMSLSCACITCEEQAWG